MANVEETQIEEGHAISKKWLLDKIEAVHGKRPTIAKVGPLGADAIGYMSLMRRVELEWVNDKDQKLPKSVIVKLPSTVAASDAFKKSKGDDGEGPDPHMTMVNELIHNTEVAAYNMFRGLEKAPLSIPLIYAANDLLCGDVPAIVMEDFRDAKILDIIPGFDEKQLFAIMDEIINLHFFCFTNDAWKVLERGETWKKLGETFNAQIVVMCEMLSTKVPQLACVKKLVDNSIGKNPNMYLDIQKLYEEGGDRISVLTHGDLWAPQILWKDDVTIAGIVDWQVAHRGSPLEDLYRVLTTSTSLENRKKLEKPLLDYYYEKLSEKMKEAGMEMPFTREYLEEEKKFVYPSTCFATIFANAFWSNSSVLSPGGIPDPVRTLDSFGRCASIVEETLELMGWS